MISELEKEYNKLVKKYTNLPSFQIIDKTFDIELSIGDKQISSRSTLRAVSNSITNYLYSFIDYLHNILFLNPSSLIVMEESKIYSQEEKQKIEFLLKKMTYLTRRNLELAILKEEKEDSEFIANAYQEWKAMKKQILFIVEKAKNHWKT